MNLLKTYAEIPHNLTGRLEIKHSGRRSAPDVSQPIHSKNKRCVWTLAKGEGYDLHGDIQLMDRREAQKAERRRKRKERLS